MSYALSTVLFVGALVVAPVGAGAAQAALPKSGAVSSRPGLDLGRLKDLQNPKLSPSQRLNLGLRLLRDEMVNPTPRPQPPYTDFQTHDYVLAQITRKLAEVELDDTALRASWERMNAGEVKDSLTLLLLLRSTRSGAAASEQTAALTRQITTYVLERQHPLRLRELAVQALGKAAVRANDAAIGQTLARVIREDSQGQYKLSTEKQTSGKLVMVFPVRRAAAAAILQMEKEGLLLESYVTQAAKSAQAEIALPERAKK